MRTNSPLTRCEQRAVHYLAMSTNSLLTPCKQGAVLSRYSDSLGTFTLLHDLAMRTNTILTRCKQRAVRYSPRSTHSVVKNASPDFHKQGLALQTMKKLYL